LGWAKDEMDVVGADMKNRSAIGYEFLQVLKAVWTTIPVEFHGKFYQLQWLPVME
jgi:alkanesulfonate monooxygenase SsuD/methylene tetrahydromethanopterin reductase-like flavin-dependent oxidoreductase (luciferase family)